MTDWEWRRAKGHETQPWWEWQLEQVACCIVTFVGRRAIRRKDWVTAYRMLAISKAGEEHEQR